MFYGAIDIGSNAIRLLIGQITNLDGRDGVKKINLIRLPIRLGQEVFEDNTISKEKQDELISGLLAFIQILKVYKVSGFQAYATSALREALNRTEVLKRVERKTGLKVRCIEGDLEAKLILGAFETLALDYSRDYLSIDVGGGSTELSLLKMGSAVMSQSFRLGTVRVMNNQDEDAEWLRMKNWIVDNCQGMRRLTGLGTGGNINRFLKLSHTKTQGFVTFFELQSLSQDLAKLTLDERILKYHLREDRADVIVPASKIYINAMDYGDIDLIQVPKIGLTDGMIYAMHKGVIDSQQLNS
ncbi:MAG: exopolyphosphatase/guanosine-5'-triphosphate,3'-diphosphate pyrophosphatase [Luteibaculaceae bacterium]|jgi:exopolyphosphatase/guanosine-5'-triphosphate,3'-diphosphate pyrophosphatase